MFFSDYMHHIKNIETFLVEQGLGMFLLVFLFLL